MRAKRERNIHFLLFVAAAVNNNNKKNSLGNILFKHLACLQNSSKNRKKVLIYVVISRKIKLNYMCARLCHYVKFGLHSLFFFAINYRKYWLENNITSRKTSLLLVLVLAAKTNASKSVTICLFQKRIVNVSAQKAAYIKGGSLSLFAKTR